MLGVIGWLIAERKRGVRLWTGSALILGAFMSWVTGHQPFIQYIIPGVLCLALFTPYIGIHIKNKAVGFSAALLLVAILVQMNARYIRGPAADFASGSSFRYFVERQELLDLIPRSEKVLGSYGLHPVFRENLAFMTNYGYFWHHPADVVPKGSPILRYLLPEYLEERLENNFPALVRFPLVDKPPNWDFVVMEFMDRYGDKYRAIEFLPEQEEDKVYIRKDLLEGDAPSRWRD